MASYKKPVQISTDEMCCYKCGNKAAYKTAAGKLICNSSPNKCPANRKKNSESIKIAHEEGRIPGWNDINPNRGWAKGHTKETHPGVAKSAAALKQRYDSGEIKRKEYRHSVEIKEILSIARINYLENNPHIEWLELKPGLKVQGKWEYNVGLKLIECGFDIIRHHIKYDTNRRYTPDFCISAGVYVEVKGWLSNRDIAKYKKFFREKATSIPSCKLFKISIKRI